MESCIPIASSRYRYDVEYSTMLSEFLQVRGTPASGKSTLAKLLGRHIHVQEPDVRVIWIGGWKLDDVAKCGGWYSYLKKRKGWIPGEDTVFIFDEAQVSYKDGELWNELFKGIHDYPDRRAIVFASYGSPSSPIDIQGTPIWVASAAKVTLLPSAHEDNLPAAGLLFNPAEFDELVLKQFPASEYRLHTSFLSMVLEMTEGHVGAMCSFINIILGSDVMYFLVDENLKLISSSSYIVDSKILENITLGSYSRKKSVQFGS
jgi:energy-coupling factor transporter ATP-binding protein EcfA2